MTGKDRGKTGKVMQVLHDADKLSLEGLNLFKKHVRPKKQGEKGEVIDVARPMHISNVALVCPSCGKATRVGVRRETETRVRYCKKCSATF